MPHDQLIEFCSNANGTKGKHIVQHCRVHGPAKLEESNEIHSKSSSFFFIVVSWLIAVPEVIKTMKTNPTISYLSNVLIFPYEMKRICQLQKSSFWFGHRNVASHAMIDNHNN